MPLDQAQAGHILLVFPIDSTPTPNTKQTFPHLEAGAQTCPDVWLGHSSLPPGRDKPKTDHCTPASLPPDPPPSLGPFPSGPTPARFLWRYGHALGPGRASQLSVSLLQPSEQTLTTSTHNTSLHEGPTGSQPPLSGSTGGKRHPQGPHPLTSGGTAELPSHPSSRTTQTPGLQKTAPGSLPFPGCPLPRLLLVPCPSVSTSKQPSSVFPSPALGL